MIAERCSRLAVTRIAIAAAAAAFIAGCSSSTEPGNGPPLDPCLTRTQLTTGSTVNGSLTSTDCSSGGMFVDHYNWTATANQAVNIMMTANTLDAFLRVTNEDGSRPIAENDDDQGAGTTNARIKLIAAAGVKRVSATSFSPNETGAYTLSVTSTNQSAESCEEVHAELGVTTQQTLSLTDCMNIPPYNDDEFRVFLAGGTRVRITMRSTAVDAWLELYDPSGEFLIDDDDSGGAGASPSCGFPGQAATACDAQIVFTVPSAGYHTVSASSANAGETGAYTLTIEVAPAGAQPLGPSGQFQRNGTSGRSVRKGAGGTLQ